MAAAAATHCALCARRIIKTANSASNAHTHTQRVICDIAHTRTHTALMVSSRATNNTTQKVSEKMSCAQFRATLLPPLPPLPRVCVCQKWAWPLSIVWLTCEPGRCGLTHIHAHTQPHSHCHRDNVPFCACCSAAGQPNSNFNYAPIAAS